MRYPPALLDEIKARLPVSQVVARRVKLKRAGREYIGLSPFKTERTPSFTVNDQKGFFHCFSSGEHGDIFKFVMMTEGLSFHEAVERLAGEAGVSLPSEPERNTAAAEHECGLREALEEGARFFEAALKGDEGAGARQYLYGRGLCADDIVRFRLGFAPNRRSALKDHLAAKGFAAEAMEEAGLLIHGEDIPVSYDRFRGRLMFPITDAKGRVIAFGGRALSKDQQPKYLNSPDTPLFHKGRVLYNFAAARQAARTSRQVIVAEGYMDVIAFTRAGLAHAVAPLGTALTEDQLKLLWTLSPAPILCFDGDAAGKKAAWRALDVALPHLEPERSLQWVLLGGGLDPDDLLRLKGAAGVAEALENRLGILEALWRREEEQHDLRTPEGLARFTDALFQHAGQIRHAALRRSVMEKLKLRLKERGWKSWRRAKAVINPDREWQTLAKVEQGLGRNRAKAPYIKEVGRSESLLNSAVILERAPVGLVREALLVRALLHHPSLIDDDVEDIAALHLEGEAPRRLRDAILIAHQGEIGLDSRQLRERLLAAGLEQLMGEVLALAVKNGDGDFAASGDKEKDLNDWRHLLAMHRKTEAELRQLPEAERDYCEDLSDENFARICAILQHREIAHR